MSIPSDETAHVLTVTALTDDIKFLMEEHFSWVQVRGEVSQPQTSRNGHLYFTLKDSGAQLSCVMWRSRRELLNTNEVPKHGDEVVVSGPIQVYPPHGRYQMIVQSVHPAGLGALQQAFEQLKKKLEAEGLFDSARKRELPRFPDIIGIVTSATGAAFQDMRNTLEKRYPMCEIRLYHASVQGGQAAPEITAGIRHFSGSEDVDLLIVGRGGGSMEDLWAFNEESVARAIAECRVPVISAVGHETDFSISDYVADARAATPTQAIVMAVPDINDLRMKIDEVQAILEKRILDLLNKHKDAVSRFLDNYALHSVKQRIARQQEMLTWRREQLGRSLENRLQRYREENRRKGDALVNVTKQLVMQKRATWNESHHLLAGMDPNAPLKKGYTRILQDGIWVRSSDRFTQGKGFDIEWADRKVAVNRGQ